MLEGSCCGIGRIGTCWSWAASHAPAGSLFRPIDGQVGAQIKERVADQQCARAGNLHRRRGADGKPVTRARRL